MASRKVLGKTWWGKAWLAALNGCDYQNRLPRGKTYFNQGHLIDIEWTPAEHVVTALVEGSQYYPYEVTVGLKPMPSAEVERLVDEIAQNADWVAALMDHQLPPEIGQLCEKLHINLFPRSMRDIEVSCTCPDSAVICKHVACVIYALSEIIDRNPFVIFELKQVDLPELLKAKGVHLSQKPKERALTIEGVLKAIEDKKIDSGETLLSLPIEALKSLKNEWLGLLPSELVASDVPHFRKELEQKIRRVAARIDFFVGERYGSDEDNGEVSAFEGIETALGISRCPLRISLASGGELSVAFDPKKGKPAGIDSLERWCQALMALLNSEVEQLTPERLLLRRALEVAARFYQSYHFLARVVREKNGLFLWLTPSVRTGKASELFERFCSAAGPTLENAVQSDEPFQGLGLRQKAFWLLSALMTQMHRHWERTSDNGSNDPYLCFIHGRVLDSLPSEAAESIENHLAVYFRAMSLPDLYPWTPMLTARRLSKGRVGINFAIRPKAAAAKPITLKKLIGEPQYESDRYTALRVMQALEGAYPELAKIRASQGKSLIIERAELKDFLFEVTPYLNLLGVSVMLPQALKNLLRPHLVAESSASSGNASKMSIQELADFSLQAALGDRVLSKEEFEDLYKQAGQVIEMDEHFVYLDADELMRMQQEIDRAKSLSPMMKVRAVLSGALDGIAIDKGQALSQKLQALSEVRDIDVPVGLRATLRPYQKRGYQWLAKNFELGLGSLIADDMGLGKTLQVIALLARLKESGYFAANKALVVVPATLLANWEREVQKFAPGLVMRRYHGVNRCLPSSEETWDLLLTTYGTATRDAAMLQKSPFNLLILDEAQAVKNSSTAQSLALRKLRPAHVIAMSGTPVENRLMEYWSIFSLVEPGLLGTADDFQKHFAQPIENDRDPQTVASFKSLTAPFMLRRLKTDKNIIADLPEREVIDRYAALLPEQAALYKKTLDRAISRIETAEKENEEKDFRPVRRAMVLKLITALKQICNSSSQYLKTETPAPDSGKGTLLLQTLSQCLQAGKKVLIFTQYREMGERLQTWIRTVLKEDVPFINGSVPVKKRADMVERFQTDPAVKCMLLSLKAAGTGLNLTAASVVIHYDLWWNPAVEAQATDRAYRIGQKQNVTVYRFITTGTFEEKINALLEDKKELADLTVTTGEHWIGDMKTDELKKLFALEDKK